MADCCPIVAQEYAGDAQTRFEFGDLASRDESPQRGADQMHAVHVIAGLDAVYGGPSYSVPRLCEALAVAGAETTLLSVAGAEGPRDVFSKGYRDQRFAWNYAHLPILRRLRSSSALSLALRNLAETADIIHNHGLWLIPNVDAGWTAARARKPAVVSPRGMLSPTALAFSRLKKRAFWGLLQGPSIRQAACIHATSEREYQEIREFGLTSPVAIIWNGIDLPNSVAEPGRRASADRLVLSLGRLHRIKGLDRLVRAWAKIEAVRPNWRLRIVGSSEAGHRDELMALAMALGLARVSIEEPAYGEAKQTAYRDADLFVLPTTNENFGITIAEALAAGIPAISTKGAPWSGLETERCGWWIDHGVEPLAAALADATAMPVEALSAMGVRGRAWMARDFSWNRVARDMLDVYRWLKGAAETPPTIRFR
jgi:glycosyltransferase involved in cell wall biosynthesis